MKYIKTQEEINTDKSPKVGDYVIMKSSVTQSLRYFIEKNIGEITQIDYGDGFLIVKYSNIPEAIQEYMPYNSRSSTIRLIKHWSSNKEDLEVILSQNKYNL